MSELIHELSDSELDAIAGGQVSVIGNLTVTANSTTTANASVTGSINSRATASADTDTTIRIG